MQITITKRIFTSYSIIKNTFNIYFKTILVGFIIIILRTIINFFMVLDKIFFPSFSKTPIKNPIIIVGNPRSGTTFLQRFLVENTKKNKLTFYNEEQFNIISGETLYFEGYFQSDKYFKSYKNDILNEFKFKEEVKNQKSSFIEMLQTKNSVSIHIRQDKFLKSEGHKDLTKLNKENLKISIKNALDGVRFFDKNLDSPKYFIWSNNFNDLREYFPESKFTFINENLQKDAAYDLYLMSLSKNFILSPSTLHYWGAFLSSNEKKI